jgi:radical SAM superfamily enzyme YgiQ (UPF0313 family)
VQTIKTLRNAAIEEYDFSPEATEKDIEALLCQLKELNPALVGISVKSAYFHVAKTITKAIRAKFQCPVIWGGPHPTIDPENCLRYVNMVCVGEGFDALLELSQQILQHKSYNNIRGIWYSDKGKILKTELRPQISDLDILPYASFDNRNKFYIDDGRRKKEKNCDYFGFSLTDEPFKIFHHTMTAFGCPMNCTYCINSLKCDKFRRRSVANVIDELSEAKEKNPYLKYVLFWDNIFTANKKWCLEFAEIYRKKIRLPFFAYVYPHASFIDREVLSTLRKANWHIVNMGIQSGSPKIRKQLYNRNESNEEILETARRLKELRFKPYYDFIKNNPLEGREELKEHLNLILSIPKPFVYQVFNMSFFPNYQLTKVFLRKGLISSEDIDGNEKHIGKSGTEWQEAFDSKKEYLGFLKIHEYYYLLCSLAQFEIFPNSVIKKIEERNLFFNKLKVLYWICRLIRFFDVYFRSSFYKDQLALFKLIPLKLKIRHKVFFRYK